VPSPGSALPPRARPTCPLCARSLARSVIESDFNLTGFTSRRYRVIECRRCRMRYVDPRPQADELARYYQEDYPAHVSLGDGERLRRAQRSLGRRYRQVGKLRCGLLRRFLGQPLHGLRLLDMGCGNGAFLLQLLRRYPVEAWGVDIAPHALQQLAQASRGLLVQVDWEGEASTRAQANGRAASERTTRSGALPTQRRRAGRRLHLKVGSLADADLPAGYFDVVTLWHVLEHDPDPVRSLQRVKGWLRPGGLVLAEVPNSAGWIARLCGGAWLGWDLPRHLVHFSPETLRHAARLAGLERVRVRHEYTLNPVCLSPLLASLELWRRRRRRRTRSRPVPYHRFDGLAGSAIRLINGVEAMLGGNGLVLAARRPLRKGD
jgi:2-polyprenyl-3-methyl-5-hydroxy-6-metoxy-1,4-benzoquinol methylase